LLVVFIKFFGFSISSWITGLRLEESFRLGLYMLLKSSLLVSFVGVSLIFLETYEQNYWVMLRIVETLL